MESYTSCNFTRLILFKLITCSKNFGPACHALQKHNFTVSFPVCLLHWESIVTYYGLVVVSYRKVLALKNLNVHRSKLLNQIRSSQPFHYGNMTQH